MPLAETSLLFSLLQRLLSRRSPRNGRYDCDDEPAKKSYGRIAHEPIREKECPEERAGSRNRDHDRADIHANGAALLLVGLGPDPECYGHESAENEEAEVGG